MMTRVGNTRRIFIMSRAQTAELEPVEAGAKPRSNPEQWVEEHGDSLFRHALARVGRQVVAEDLVQETFLAAWGSRNRFAGRSSERTWLVRILRHKIADYYRRQKPEVSLDDPEVFAVWEEQQFELGALGGKHWNASAAPTAWKNARQSLEQSEFWITVNHCTRKLPSQAAQVFLLREVDGWETGEICRTMKIKQSHLFVILHRARLALRRCLEANWFKPFVRSG
jgi:RNA polymerase sigma-70 factor (TIGR02943 family)